MGNLNLILTLCLLGPLAMMLLVFRDRSRVVLGFLMAGIISCLLAGEINGLIRELSYLPTETLSVNVTPIVEELLKAIPIAFYALVFQPKKELLLESSISVGVGFALLENAYILSSCVNQVSFVWALFRVLGAGMVHGICTLSIGWAMSYIYEKKKMIFVGSFGVFAAAVTYHSIYNMIVQSSFPYLGIVLPILTYIPLIVLMTKLKQLKSKK